MLLIGSRAIRHYFPEFRAPRDWDLVATAEEIEHLAERLPKQGPQRPEKAHFRYEDRMVEVANSSLSPYWAKVTERFAGGPQLHDPVLGSLIVPPPDYLLLTKHCGLVYRVVHWHKNLEDLYFLRERIPTMDPAVVDLVADTVNDSAGMFAESHARALSHAHAKRQTLTCYGDRDATSPEAAQDAQDPLHDSHDGLHTQLHACLKLGAQPMRDLPKAWQGFPEVPAAQRVQHMQRLFAEEAMVIAARAMMDVRAPTKDTEKARSQRLRWALRSLCTGELPVGLRYFIVNYYREIRALVPDDWYDRVAELRGAVVSSFQPCDVPASGCASTSGV
jgi:hypothetical protein